MRDTEIVTSELYTLQLEDDVPLGSGLIFASFCKLMTKPIYRERKIEQILKRKMR